MEKYKTFYPGQYSDEEKRALDKAREEIKGKIGKPAIGMGGPAKPLPVTEEALLSHAQRWDGFNPMYCSKEYADKSCWGGLIAYPGSVNVSAVYPMLNPYASSFGDFFYYGVDGGEYEFYREIRPGDILTTITTHQDIVDVTDENGSPARKFLLIGEAEVYDQKNELVAKLQTTARNSMKKILDGSPVPDLYAQTFEWKTYDDPLSPHVTTDEEWQRIYALWDQEKIRGSETLYWDDVNVGDQLTPTCSGPITVVDMIRFHGQTFFELPGTRKLLNSGLIMQDKYGMKYHTMARHYFDCHQNNSGALFYNTTARDLVLRTVTNWMSDAGLVTKFGWEFCNTFRDIYEPGNGAALLARVPYMAGKFCNRHGMEGDTVIGNGYVTGKYQDESGAYIELVCWGETLTGDVVQVVPVTVKLPVRG